jgi:DNA modification methylase
MNKIKNIDSLEYLKTLPDNSVDIIYSDPPYALGSEVIIKLDGKPDYKKAVDFMNRWSQPDGAFWEEWFIEAKRVLKHGGHCLMFGIDRQLWFNCYYANLSGFTQKQSLYWYFISNFPKSSSLPKNLDKSIDKNNILFQNIDICLTLNNVKLAEYLSQKKQQEAGTLTNKKELVQESASTSLESKKVLTQDTNLIVQIVDWKLNDTKSVAEVKLNIVVENAKQNITQQPLNAIIAENLLQDQTQGVKVESYTVQKSVQIKLLEKITDKIKEGEAQKTLNGKDKYWRTEDINVLCVELLKDLRHTILNQSLNILNYDIQQATDFVFATIAITTKSTTDNLIISTASLLESMLKEKQISEKYKDIRYSVAPLKQTNETIMVFQKPYKTGSCLHDVLAMEAGDNTLTCSGVDIEGNRVATDEKTKSNGHIRKVNVIGDDRTQKGAGQYGEGAFVAGTDLTNGRFPAQTFIDTKASDVIDRQSGILKSGARNPDNENNTTTLYGFGGKGKPTPSSSGGASRILHKCDFEAGEYDLYLYEPKVSKKERNAGCEEFKETKFIQYQTGNGQSGKANNLSEGRNTVYKNTHPTLKPIKLNERILRLFKTPNDQVILYPFAGSGSEIIGGLKAGFTNYLACEINKEYIDIANARIEYWSNKIEIENQKIELKYE